LEPYVLFAKLLITASGSPTRRREILLDRRGEQGNIDGIAKPSIFMSQPFDKDLVEILARAFDAAWQDYYGEPRSGALPEATARPSLAGFLVARAKEGMTDEAAMAAAGLEHLISLTPVEANELSGERAMDAWRLSCSRSSARFGDLWRIRITKLGGR
jgi:hypothetical protein